MPQRSYLNILFDIALLCIITTIFVIVVDLRKGAAVGWVDSAIYHSFFLDKESIIQRTGATYFASRWPWILLGSAIFQYVPQQFSSLVFSICILCVISICTYFFARNFFTPAVALIVGVIASCNMQVAATVSGAYPSALASAILLLGANAALHAYRNDNVFLMFFAGLLYGLAVVTHPFSFVIGIVLHLCIFIACAKYTRWGRELAFLGGLLVGGVAILPVSYLAYLGYSLPPEVVNHIFATAQRSVTGGQGQAFHKGFPFLFSETGSYLFFLSGVLSTIYSLKMVDWRWSSLSRNTRLLHGMFLALLSVLILWDMVFNAVTLQYPFYNVFLYGVTALQLGGFLGSKGGLALTSRLMSVSLAAILIIFLLVAVYLVNSLASGILPVAILTASLIVFTFLVAVFSSEQALAKQGKIFPKTALFSILFVSCVISSSLTRYGVSARDPVGNGNEGTEVIHWALALTDAHTTQPTQPLLFAYNRGDFQLGPEYPLRNDRWEFFFLNKRYFFNIFDTVAAVSGWGDGMITTDFARFDFSRASHYLAYASDVKLLVLYNENDQRKRVKDVQDRAMDAGFQVKFESAGVYDRKTIKFSWSILSLGKQP